MPRNLCLPWELNSHSTNRSHRVLTPAWLGQQWEPVVGQFSGTATRSRGPPQLMASKQLIVATTLTMAFLLIADSRPWPPL